MLIDVDGNQINDGAHADADADIRVYHRPFDGHFQKIYLGFVIGSLTLFLNSKKVHCPLAELASLSFIISISSL